MQFQAFKARFAEVSTLFYVWATYKKDQPTKKKTVYSRKLNPITLAALVTLTVLAVPDVAFAQTGISGALSGITEILKEVGTVLIFEWGYYLGIIALAIQGIRWKMGRINAMELGGWALGICLVFFSPSIVSSIRAKAGSSL